MVTVPIRFPTAVGANVTVIVQFPPPAMGEEETQVSLSVKLALATTLAMNFLTRGQFEQR